MNKIYIILVVFFGLITNTNGQNIPANKQTKSILILNGFAHLGNGKVIDIAEMICPITVVDEGSDMSLFEGSHYGYFIPHHKIYELKQQS